MSASDEEPSVRVLITEAEITTRLEELAREISRDYEGKDLVLVCVLKGSMVFFADLARKITTPLSFDYICVSSYDSGTESEGSPELRTDLSEPVSGRHVLIVEDIVDTGLTMEYLFDLLASRGAASLKVVALLDKPARRKREVEIAYRGFEIPDEFVVGYGLDYRQRYRNLPYIGSLELSSPLG
jgi:hypoxanthine phosphoribosyltransferase